MKPFLPVFPLSQCFANMPPEASNGLYLARERNPLPLRQLLLVEQTMHPFERCCTVRAYVGKHT